MKQINTYLIEKFKITKDINLSIDQFFNTRELDVIIDEYFSKLLAPLFRRRDYSVTYEKSEVIKDNKPRLNIKVSFNERQGRAFLEKWLGNICRNINEKTDYEWTHRNTYDGSRDNCYLELCIKDKTD